MIPFNLEKALAGDPVITREGKKVLEIKLFEKRTQDPVVYLVASKYEHNANEMLYATDKEGKSFCNPDFDLFMVPKKIKLFIAVLKEPFNNSSYSVSDAYNSIETLKSGWTEKTHHYLEIEIDEE